MALNIELKCTEDCQADKQEANPNCQVKKRFFYPPFGVVITVAPKTCTQSCALRLKDNYRDEDKSGDDLQNKNQHNLILRSK